MKQTKCKDCKNNSLLREDVIRIEGKIDTIKEMQTEYNDRVKTIEKRVWGALIGGLTGLGSFVISLIKH